MGLDMYLIGKRTLSEHFNKGDIELSASIQKLFPELNGMGGRQLGFKSNIVDEIRVMVAYWRKSNQIHNWFVKNVQYGKDECVPHYVSREDLISLREVCQKVLEDPSMGPSLLPTKEGFFFGSIQYNDYYIDDLKLTLQFIDSALSLPNSWEFEYDSSW